MRNRTFHNIVVGLLILLPLGSYGQFTSLFTEDFDACGPQATLAGQCSWNTVGSGSRWTITNGGGCAINGAFSLAVGSDATYCQYNRDFGTSNRIAYRQFNAAGYQALRISFNWKSVGQTNVDYGRLVYSTTGSVFGNFLDVNSTNYQNQGPTATVSNLVLPGPMNNDAVVYIGYRWIDNGGTGAFPGFTIDDINLEGEVMTPANPTGITSNSPQCGNVTLTRVGSPPSPSNVIWYWQGTACGTSTVLGSGATFSAPSTGTYYLRAYNTLSSTWSLGCVSIAVVVDSPLPTANAGVGGDECDLTYQFSGVPSIGTGTWTQQAGPGTSSYAPNANNAIAIATATTFGTYTYRWTEVNGACVDFDDVVVNFYQDPSANPGAGSAECDLNYTFGATPSVGIGTWTQVSGPGTTGYAPSANSPAAVATASAYGVYTYRWTEVNGTCSDFAEITVSYDQAPIADGGPSGNECDLNFTLGAVPSIGSGIWTKQTGPGFVSFFPNASASGATVTATSYGTYVFRWTETNGPCTDFDDVTVIFSETPNTNAGAGGFGCGILDFGFTAIPSVGSGLWTIASGPGTAIYNPTNNSAGATATVSVMGVYTFQWTETNGICSDFDQVVVEFVGLPVVSFSGLGGPHCISDTAAVPLTGAPLGGTFSGNGIVGNNFYPNLAAVGTNAITYTYTDGNGCTNTDVQNVTIIGLPIVSFTGLVNPYCEDDATPAVLTGTPAGGTFSGTGVFGNTFTPTLAGPGLHAITYVYVDGNGCSGTETQSINVNTLPFVTFTGLSSDYCLDDAIAVLTGIPAGGIFSGNGITGNNFDPAVAGVGVHSITYSYTDPVGCFNDSIMSVTVNALPVVSFSGLNPTYCITAGSSVLTGSPLGGAFGGPGISGSSFFPAIADIGTHLITYTYTDGNSCVKTDTQTVIVTPIPVASFTGLSATICVASIPDTLVGSPGPGTFTGNGIILGDVFDPAIAGVGSHIIKFVYADGGGCSDSTTQTVVVNSSPLVTFSGLDSLYCADGDPSALTGFPVGGTFSGPGVSGSAFDPVVAGVGTHTVQYAFIDLNGCSDSTTLIAVVVALPTVSFSGLNASYCVVAPSTLLTGSPLGGSFSGTGISGSSFFPSVAGTGSHTITYTYTDGDGCTNTQGQIVTVTALPTVSFSGLSATYCASNSPDVLSGTPAGGTFSGPGIVGSTFDPSLAGVGTHTIQYMYSDGGGCADSTTQSVTVNADSPFLSVDSVSTTEAACDSTCDATAEVIGSGGVAPYTYAWSNGDVGVIADSLCASTFFITVTDARGCTSSNDIMVAGPNGFMSSITSTTMITTCFGDCTGGATAGGIGGMPPYTYSWVDSTGLPIGGSSSTIAALCAGSYYAIVKDDSNCVTTAPFTITQPDVLVPTICNLQNVSCNSACDGAATACPSGGTGPFTYLWDDSGAQTTAMATGLCAGTYRVDVTDAQGCTKTDSTVVVTEPSPVVATITGTTNANCDTLAPIGTVTATASGGAGTFQYAWNTTPQQSNSVAVGLLAGSYTVTVTDATGCTDTAIANVGDTSSMTASITNLVLSSCTLCDGSATVTPTGSVAPYVYDWLDSLGAPIGETDSLADSLCGGLYRVTVMSSVFCIRSVPANTESPPPVASFTGLTTPHCTGDPADVLTGTPVGGAFSGPGVSGSNFDPAVAGVGSHVVKYVFIDGSGCSDSSMQTVVVNALPTVSFTGLDTGYCVDASLVALSGTPTGGIFSGPGMSGALFDPSMAGAGAHTIQYKFTTVDGCSDSTTQSVNVNALPTLSIIGLNPIYCVDAPAAVLSGSLPGGIFTGLGISGSSFYPFIADTGTHLITYTYTSGAGCTNSQIDTVTVTPVPVVSFTGLSAQICAGAVPDTLVGSPIGGIFSGIGVTGSNLFDPGIAGAGVFTVTYVFSDGVGCTDSSSQLVQVMAQPAVGLAGLSAGYCIDGSASTLTGFPAGGTFSGPGITGNIFDPVVADTGTHSITYSYTDGNGCTQDTIQITTVNPLPSPIITAGGPTTFCLGSSVTLTSSLAASYSWNTGDTTSSIAAMTTGSYTVTVVDSNSCMATSAPISVTADPNVLVLATTSTVSCGNTSSGTATVTVVGGLSPYNYVWDDLNTQTTSTAINLPGGTFTVIVTDANSCTKSTSASVTQIPGIVLTMDSTDASSGQFNGSASVTVAGGSAPYTYEWSDGQSSSMATGLSAGDYSVTVTDGSGCVSIGMVTVAEAKVHPATAFTPNDDGVNDAWVLEDMIYYPDAEVTIFNRWGEQLYNANGMEYAANPWDGTYKGRKLPFGGYFYIINLKNGDKPMTGSVTILK